MAKQLLLLLGLCVLVGAGCSFGIPSKDEILDSKLLDRRIKDSPRDAALRECRQEAEQFRVDCALCHTKVKEDEIKAPELFLTDSGRRAQIMRKSQTFGQQQPCTTCHQSKFVLNQYAQKLFGPKGARYQEAEKELAKPVQ